MSRYSDFEESQREDSILNEEDREEIVCVKNLLSKPNPLMNRVQFTPYEPRCYYPAMMNKVPSILNTHQYHTDSNNMTLLDQAVFSHLKMKKDLACCLFGKATLNNSSLATLRQFYSDRTPIYEKYLTHINPSDYFATFILKMNQIQGKPKSKAGFLIRNNKIPLTERSKTERVSFQRSNIQFNSNFEGGNLFKVYQRQYNQYDLILQNDINTKGNNQWFYFNVKNVPKNTTLKFHIVNMTKQHSLFDMGMKPAVFSLRRYQRRSVGWVRDGTKVSYTASKELKKQISETPYFTLSFDYKFQYEGDIVYFSYSIPYTFSNLCSFLTRTLSQPTNNKVKVRSLGNTLGGNQVTLFDLTNLQSKFQKQGIWILGRQHSGQVTSSFMMEGIFNFLLSDHPDALYLLDHYYFRIVPMINIDGVVHGNTRAQLSGYDPNRKWANPSSTLQPILYNLKKLISRDSVAMVLDLHSHSRKLGTFFYCNSSPQFSQAIKMFPMLVSQKDNRFDYRSHRFKGGNNETARRVLYQILQIPYIYTIESSLYGYQKEGDFRIIPYQPQDYRQMAVSVLITFSELNKNKKNKGINVYKEEESELLQKIKQIDDIQSIGSDQDPGADELSRKQLDLIFQKKTKKTTKRKKRLIKNKVQKKEPSKKEQEQPKIKKNDKESHYKKFFSGKSSLNPLCSQTVFENNRLKKETKNFGCQINFIEKAVLHKNSLNIIPSTSSMTNKQSKNRLFEKKSLCVVGQKVQDDLSVNGLSVGVQAQSDRCYFRSRNQLQLENYPVVKKTFRSSNKISTFTLHNQNNFLNRGDLVHNALRILSKK